MTLATSVPTAAPLIVLITAPVTDAAIVEAIRSATGRHGSAVVVAPALSSAVRYWTNDVTGRRQALERLDASLAVLRDAGLDVEGEIGDDDPLQALDDAVAIHGASEIVLVTPPADRRGWLEVGLVTAASERTGLEVRHLVAGATDGPASDHHRDGPTARRHPFADLALTLLLALAATFGSGVTFLMIARGGGWAALGWAIVFDVIPKLLFGWVLWRLYLKRR